MSRRPAVTVLVAATLAIGLVGGVAGCGGATSTDAEATGGGGALTLAVEPDEPVRTGSEVTWHLVVVNGTGADVVLGFRTGQRGDVVLRDTDGTEAYRWSEGMMFTQSLDEVPLAAGEETTFTLAGPLDVAPGGYVLEASVVSEPAPEPLRADLTVEG